MARAGKMTALKVAAIARARARGYYGDGGGLFLQISRFGTASWAFRHRMAGRLREMGLGSLDTIGLADARVRARKAREQRLDGLDPIELRKAASLAAQLDSAKAITFKECARRYIAAHRPAWRNPKHAPQWGSTLEAYVVRNPKRRDQRPGSFKVNLATGRWADFATGDRGGDPISLAAYLAGCRQVEAARRVAVMLGLAAGG